ncbi:phosphopantetheine-binding protein [Streptomyces sp. DH18]|uniref:phosphopantetheine-binding protein n=1 Tax=Streptomyces sp. DH18 TaxID=3040126 RepID=UPI002441D363|nr:phosphopantetheine-binding protein [Streptomyces sp. DH18]MDG9688365.1 phosphopantetheine-binding protein [Streptomyces sp. DH18]
MTQHALTSPSTTVVLGIIAEILDVPKVTADDNFYDFGGSSLQAMRICARLRKDWGVHAAPDALFEADTLGDFAAVLAV